MASGPLPLSVYVRKPNIKTRGGRAVKASTWKWIAIAFIALFAIMTFLALTYYFAYNSEVSAYNSEVFSCEIGATSTSSVSTPSEQILVNDQTVNEPAGSAYDFNFNIQHAGYIEVIVSSSTTSNTYVEISGTYSPPSSWHSPNEGWTYDSGQISVGRGGTVFFPVVPGTVTVAVGNTNAFSGATETVTIVYYS